MQWSAAPAAGGDRQGNCCEYRTDRVQRDQLSDQRLGHIQAAAHLRQQAGGHGFGHDRDESGGGQCQQRAEG